MRFRAILHCAPNNLLCVSTPLATTRLFDEFWRTHLIETNERWQLSFLALHLTIAPLVKASRDRDDGVRNNVIRALGVLAQSNRKIAGMIPAEEFVAMLNSGTWKDRNK